MILKYTLEAPLDGLFDTLFEGRDALDKFASWQGNDPGSINFKDDEGLTHVVLKTRIVQIVYDDEALAYLS